MNRKKFKKFITFVADNVNNKDTVIWEAWDDSNPTHNIFCVSIFHGEKENEVGLNYFIFPNGCFKVSVDGATWNKKAKDFSYLTVYVDKDVFPKAYEEMCYINKIVEQKARKLTDKPERLHYYIEELVEYFNEIRED